MKDGKFRCHFDTTLAGTFKKTSTVLPSSGKVTVPNKNKTARIFKSRFTRFHEQEDPTVVLQFFMFSSMH